MDYKQLAGTTLGQYEIQTLLTDEANVVATYRSRQPALKRDVALQILNPRLADDDQFRRGFMKGAEILAQLEHPNIVPIYDFGEQDGFTYTAIRFLSGGSLRQWLQRKQRLTVPEVANIIKQVAGALEYVHSKGMVHGDPSAANIVFDETGNGYLADFIALGLMLTLDDKGDSLTGTPLYTAPEKWMSGISTPASDQYALACITFQMLTGSPPFNHDNLVALMVKHAQEVPPLVQDFGADLPVALDRVFQRGLAKNLEDRYPTILDFAHELELAANTAPQHLFISYSRRDTDYAKALKAHVRDSGFEVWLDDQIEHGDQWFNEIHEAIKGCAAFLVVMSPAAEESEWVQKEILLAKRYKKPIFPLLRTGQEFAILIDIQYADVRSGEMPGVDFHRRLRRTVFGIGGAYGDNQSE